MNPKIKIILALVVIITSYAIGRWSAPEKIVEKIKTVEVVKEIKVKETDKERHKKITITETVRPDGTRETITVITDDRSSTTTSHTDTDSSTTTESSKEIINSSSKVTILALVGSKLEAPPFSPPIYGLSASRPILGPVTFGITVLAMPNIAAMAGLGLTF